MKRSGIIAVAAVLLAVVGLWWTLSEDATGMAGNRSSDAEKRSSGQFSAESGTSSSRGKSGREAVSPPSRDYPSEDAASPSEEPQTEEEKAAAAEEAKVDGFDNLTDKWMEPSDKGVAMKDVDGFVAAFRQVPKDRRDECIHRALNLIPDENVMLLAGVLMDKDMDKETVETVFNDILNRDEDVKKPILQQIFKDKTHPCWTDAAWILDVTGDVPAAQGQAGQACVLDR